MVGKVNPGDRFLYLDKNVKTFALIEIRRKYGLKDIRRYFQINPLEVYFDDTYNMRKGQPILGVKFSPRNFHTPKSINKIKNSHKKRIIFKIFKS